MNDSISVEREGVLGVAVGTREGGGRQGGVEMC